MRLKMNKKKLAKILKTRQLKLKGKEIDVNKIYAKLASKLDPCSMAFVELLKIRWVPAGKDFKCPDCGLELQRSAGLMIGPFSGAIQCSCGYYNSVYNYLAKEMIKVVPMEDEVIENGKD